MAHKLICLTLHWSPWTHQIVHASCAWPCWLLHNIVTYNLYSSRSIQKRMTKLYHIHLQSWSCLWIKLIYVSLSVHALTLSAHLGFCHHKFMTHKTMQSNPITTTPRSATIHQTTGTMSILALSSIIHHYMKMLLAFCNNYLRSLGLSHSLMAAECCWNIWCNQSLMQHESSLFYQQPVSWTLL